MIIHADGDDAIPVSESEILGAAGRPDRTDLWVVPNIRHLGAREFDPVAYDARVAEFFRDAMGLPSIKRGWFGPHRRKCYVDCLRAKRSESGDVVIQPQNGNGKILRREAVRAIIIDGRRLLMIYSRIDGCYKFPGGGIEPDETWSQALTREVSEECGAIISKIGRPFHRVVEYAEPREVDYEGLEPDDVCAQNDAVKRGRGTDVHQAGGVLGGIGAVTPLNTISSDPKIAAG